jgi:hypothetical protein
MTLLFASLPSLRLCVKGGKQADKFTQRRKQSKDAKKDRKMRRVKNSKPTLFAALTLVLCFSGSFSSFFAQEHSSSGSSKTVVDWIEQEFDSGAMSISSPTKLTIVDTSDSDNANVKNYTYVGSASATIFVVQYSVLKEDTDEWSTSARSVFYDTVWGSVQPGLDATFKKQDPSLNVELSEKRAAKLGANNGMEFLFTVGKLKGSMRIIAKGHRAYCALILAPPDLYTTWSTRFFDSCKV